MIKIFCEGIGDQIFIADFIEAHFQIVFEREIKKKGIKVDIKNSKIEIIPIDGCANINKDFIKQQFVNNTEIGGYNILIFDADYTGISGNNGYENCITMIHNLRNHQTLPIVFEHFLWPNNKSDGVFENLLEKLIPVDKREVISCLESNSHCLNILKEKLEIRVPTIKEKLSSYLYLFNQPTNVHQRSYINDCWHLRIEECEELLDFKNFLSPYIL
jgi:hypothetical protein